MTEVETISQTNESKVEEQEDIVTPWDVEGKSFNKRNLIDLLTF